MNNMLQYRKLLKGMLSVFLMLWFGNTFAQVLPAYLLFDAKGKKLSHKKMMRTLEGADVILFGEYHDNAIVHWLQLEVSRALADKGPLILGAEMIERDDQQALDRYLRGEIDQAGLDTLARLWKNHTHDYAPLTELARERKFPFIATNVPRRFARAVARGGFEALDTVPEPERAWFAPLPITFDPDLPGYKRMLDMMGDHATADVVKAQALKDATMAWSIAEHARPGSRFLHFNGTFHSDHFDGIGHYLRGFAPTLEQITIATVTGPSGNSLSADHIGKADIIIWVHEDIPGTH